MKVNVYYTIDPGFMNAYAEIVSKLCFGVKATNNNQYSFTVNSATGHFNFKLDPSLINSASTPQSEAEAKKLAEEFISKVQNKNALERLKNKNFPELFNPTYYKFLSVSAIYSEEETTITGWMVLYGIEITTISGGARPKKTMLENDTIILQISGKSVTALNYNHTPIIKNKEFVSTSDELVGLVYQTVNQNTLAPYYATPNGYVPACSESIAIRTKASTIRNKMKPPVTPCKSMLTLTKFSDPVAGIPGSAKMVIAMDYRIITHGEGAVDNIEVIKTDEFEKIFKRGNAPGIEPDHKDPLQLTSLPSSTLAAVLITDVETKLSKEIDPLTGTPVFWKYYNVTIEYEYTLKADLGYTLWEGLTWMNECPYSRGLISNQLFIAAFEDYSNKKEFLTIGQIKNTMSEELRKHYTRSDFKDILVERKNVARKKALIEMIILVLKGIISDDKKKFKDANLYIATADDGGKIKGTDKIFSDPELNILIESIGSILFNDPDRTITVNPDPDIPLKPTWINISEFKNYYDPYIVPLFNFMLHHLEDFKEGDESPNIGGAGMNEGPNVIVLNNRLFGKSEVGKPFYYIGMTPAEILAHEAGHNAAKVFVHTTTQKGPYEYDQTGLQSRKNSMVYPTLFDNTFKIINDYKNRQNMTIL